MRESALIRLMQSCALGLLVLFTLPLLLPGSQSIGWWLMQILPLLLLLPRLHTSARRPLQWLGFLVLFYFTAGVLQLFHPALLQRWLGGLTVLCCLILFVAAIVRLKHIARPSE
jgi:uncharacterized membrane protein